MASVSLKYLSGRVNILSLPDKTPLYGRDVFQAAKDQGLIPYDDTHYVVKLIYTGVPIRPESNVTGVLTDTVQVTMNAKITIIGSHALNREVLVNVTTIDTCESKELYRYLNIAGLGGILTRIMEEGRPPIPVHSNVLVDLQAAHFVFYLHPGIVAYIHHASSSFMEEIAVDVPLDSKLIESTDVSKALVDAKVGDGTFTVYGNAPPPIFPVQLLINAALAFVPLRTYTIVVSLPGRSETETVQFRQGGYVTFTQLFNALGMPELEGSELMNLRDGKTLRGTLAFDLAALDKPLHVRVIPRVGSIPQWLVDHEGRIARKLVTVDALANELVRAPVAYVSVPASAPIDAAIEYAFLPKEGNVRPVSFPDPRPFPKHSGIVMFNARIMTSGKTVEFPLNCNDGYAYTEEILLKLKEAVGESAFRTMCVEDIRNQIVSPDVKWGYGSETYDLSKHQHQFFLYPGAPVFLRLPNSFSVNKLVQVPFLLGGVTLKARELLHFMGLDPDAFQVFRLFDPRSEQLDSKSAYALMLPVESTEALGGKQKRRARK